MSIKKLLYLICAIVLIIVIGLAILNLKHDKIDPKANKVNYEEFNVPFNEIPKNHTYINNINDSEIILKKEDNIVIYNRNNKSSKIFAQTLDKKNYFRKIKYFGDWLVWLEEVSEVSTETNNDFGLKWTIVAKNIKTDETRIIDKSKELKEIKYRYAPSNIEIHNNKIVYFHTDYENDDFCGVIKCYDLDTKDLSIIDKLNGIDDKFVNNVSIYNDIIVWSNPHMLASNSARLYRFSDLYTYNLKTKRKDSLISNMYILDPYIYNDKVYAVRYLSDTNTDIIEIDVNTKEISSLINIKSNIYSHFSDNFLILQSPKVFGNTLTWWESTSNRKYYYNLTDKTFARINDNAENQEVFNGYILFKDTNSNKWSLHKIE